MDDDKTKDEKGKGEKAKDAPVLPRPAKMIKLQHVKGGSYHHAPSGKKWSGGDTLEVPPALALKLLPLQFYRYDENGHLNTVQRFNRIEDDLQSQV